jgi:hypothetical protein
VNRIPGPILLFCILIGCANPEEKARTLFNQAQAVKREARLTHLWCFCSRVRTSPNVPISLEANCRGIGGSDFLSSAISCEKHPPLQLYLRNPESS